MPRIHHFRTGAMRHMEITNSSGNVKYGLIDSLNHLLKDNKGTRYDDNPYDTSTPWNQLVKQITGYDCIESLRLHYVEELKNGTWTFTGFGNYSDNWITTDLPGVPNIDYPAYVGKTHGNTTGTKLSVNQVTQRMMSLHLNLLMAICQQNGVQHQEASKIRHMLYQVLSTL